MNLLNLLTLLLILKQEKDTSLTLKIRKSMRTLDNIGVTNIKFFKATYCFVLNNTFACATSNQSNTFVLHKECRQLVDAYFIEEQLKL